MLARERERRKACRLPCLEERQENQTRDVCHLPEMSAEGICYAEEASMLRPLDANGGSDATVLRETRQDCRGRTLAAIEHLVLEVPSNLISTYNR